MELRTHKDKKTQKTKNKPTKNKPKNQPTNQMNKNPRNKTPQHTHNLKFTWSINCLIKNWG